MANYTLNIHPDAPTKVLWCNEDEKLLDKLVLAKHPNKKAKVLCIVKLSERCCPREGQFYCCKDTAGKLLPKEKLSEADNSGATVYIHEAAKWETWWYSSTRWGILAAGTAVATAVLARLDASPATFVTATFTAAFAFVHNWKSRKP